MQERVAHQSLVPRWVRRWAIDCEIPHKAIASHLVDRAMMYVGIAFIALVVSAMVWMLVGLYFQTPTHEPVVSAWTILALPAVVTTTYGALRFSAFRWLRKNWRDVTGEEDLQRYLYVTEPKSNQARETLRKVALKVRNGELCPERFHLVRDIAALHWLCLSDLRIRDLVKS
jgi:hypothetical protein